MDIPEEAGLVLLVVFSAFEDTLGKTRCLPSAETEEEDLHRSSNSAIL
jgi:hypothetical protein